jgi:hypothetical protein
LKQLDRVVVRMLDEIHHAQGGGKLGPLFAQHGLPPPRLGDADYGTISAKANFMSSQFYACRFCSHVNAR